MTAVSAATATTDLYPTRSGETTEILPRRGPVVFGSPEDGPLEAADLKHFEDAGYLTIDQLITSEELTLFTDELQRLSRDPEVKADERTVVEAESDEVRSIFDIHRTNEIFRKIANDPHVRSSEAMSISIRAGSTTSRDSSAKSSPGIRTSRPGMLRTECPLRAR